MVPGVVQPSELDWTRKRCRAIDEKPSNDSGRRDDPEGHVQNQLRNGSRLAVSRKAVAKPCHERSPVERKVNDDGGNHDQCWQPMQVQPGEASEAERGRAKGSLAPVQIDEKNQSARERQECGDKENNTNKKLEMIATHALILGACVGSRVAQPTNRASLQTNRTVGGTIPAVTDKPDPGSGPGRPTGCVRRARRSGRRCSSRYRSARRPCLCSGCSNHRNPSPRRCR